MLKFTTKNNNSPHILPLEIPVSQAPSVILHTITPVSQNIICLTHLEVSLAFPCFLFVHPVHFSSTCTNQMRAHTFFGISWHHMVRLSYDIPVAYDNLSIIVFQILNVPPDSHRIRLFHNVLVPLLHCVQYCTFLHNGTAEAVYKPSIN